MREELLVSDVTEPGSRSQGAGKPKEHHREPSDQPSHRATIDRGEINKQLKNGNDAAFQLLQCQQEFNAIESGYQKRKQGVILRVYAVASYLQEDEQAWIAFCKHPGWKEYAKAPRVEHRPLALRYALRLAIGFSAAGTKDVSRYYRILNPFFEQMEPVQKVEERVAKAGGLIALGRRRRTRQQTKSSIEAVDNPHWSSCAFDRAIVRLRSNNPLADRGSVVPNVQILLKESVEFHRHHVVVPQRLAGQARALNYLYLLIVAAWLAHDRDAWDEFCRSKEWINQKRKPHLDRPEEAFIFVVFALSRRIGPDLKTDPLYNVAKRLWQTLFKTRRSSEPEPA